MFLLNDCRIEYTMTTAEYILRVGEGFVRSMVVRWDSGTMRPIMAWGNAASKA